MTTRRYDELWPTNQEQFNRNLVDWLNEGASLPSLEMDMTPSSTTPTITARLTAAQGGIAAEAAEDWHEIGATNEPAFQNSWVNYAAGLVTAAFRKFPDGRVLIKGTIKNGSAIGTTFFTLPAGYRPGADMTFATDSGGAFGRFQVQADGDVVGLTGVTTFIQIHCSFFAEG